MSEPAIAPVECSLIVLRVAVAEATGDEFGAALRQEFQTRYEQSGAIHAVIDMQTVTYLSSVIIGPLLALKRQVRERIGRLILCGMTSDVEGVFQATKLIVANSGMPATFEHQSDVISSIQSLYHAGSNE